MKAATMATVNGKTGKSLAEVDLMIRVKERRNITTKTARKMKLTTRKPTSAAFPLKLQEMP